ncbi:uncharacterized protein LOC129759591 [Uranotaenia lowii]|uniref:uncharacterized protein LOC129759591 n=1 Tax=Uranotaenia lowii TaxID=190385 RepID=UPI00247AC4BD|nr:uncharacterized protein LOC129759591 [Uranotaenia lowii]
MTMSSAKCSVCSTPSEIAVNQLKPEYLKLLKEMMTNPSPAETQEYHSHLKSNLPEEMCKECFTMLDKYYSVWQRFKRTRKPIKNCYLCDRWNNNMVSVFVIVDMWKVQISVMICYLTGLLFRRQDFKEEPRICPICINELNIGYEFKKRLLKANESLQNTSAENVFFISAPARKKANFTKTFVNTVKIKNRCEKLVPQITNVLAKRIILATQTETQENHQTTPDTSLATTKYPWEKMTYTSKREPLHLLVDMFATLVPVWNEKHSQMVITAYRCSVCGLQENKVLSKCPGCLLEIRNSRDVQELSKLSVCFNAPIRARIPEPKRNFIDLENKNVFEDDEISIIPEMWCNESCPLDPLDTKYEQIFHEHSYARCNSSDESVDGTTTGDFDITMHKKTSRHDEQNSGYEIVYDCAQCCSRFTKKAEYDIHLQLHGEEKCNRSDHLRHLVISGPVFKCTTTDCIVVCRTLSAIEQHIASKTTVHINCFGLKFSAAGGFRYTCCIPDCTYRCVTFAGMTDHAKENHVDLLNANQSLVDRNPYSCPVCYTRLSSNDVSSVLAHIASASTSSTQRKTQADSRIQYPVSTYTTAQDEQQKCDDCLRAFDSAYALRCHRISVHTKAKWFHCRKGCTQSFTCSGLREKHEKTKHKNLSQMIRKADDRENKSRNVEDTGFDHSKVVAMNEIIISSESEDASDRDDLLEFQVELEDREAQSDNSLIDLSNGEIVSSPAEEISYEILKKKETEPGKKYVNHEIRIYQCCVPFCSAQFLEADHLNQHLSFFHKSDFEVYENTCQYCDGIFENEYRLLEHFSISIVMFECRLMAGCDFVTTSIMNMVGHFKRNVHGRQPHLEQIPFIQFDVPIFNPISSWYGRMLVLQLEAKFCCGCKRFFRFSSEFELHVKKYHPRKDNKPLQCDTCSREFRRGENLAQHEEMLSNEVFYYCKPCRILFWHKEEAQKHDLEVKHSDGRFDFRSTAWDDRYDIVFVCDHCCLIYTTADELEKHQKTHPSEENLSKCTRKDHNHYSISGKTYKCKVTDCFFMCKEISQIQDHIATDDKYVHVDEFGLNFSVIEPIYNKCCFVECRQSYDSLENLKNHVKKDHADQLEANQQKFEDYPFQCAVCRKGSFYEKSRLRHRINVNKREGESIGMRICSRRSMLNRCCVDKGCDHPYELMENLIQHAKDCHADRLEKNQTRQRKKPHQCPVCLKTYLDPAHLAKHRKAVNNGLYKSSQKVIWECCCIANCNLAFDSREKLILHARHSHQSFIETQSLKKKKKMHCQVCFKGFNKNGGLTNHRLKANKKAKASHMKLHRTCEQKVCEVCLETFNGQAELDNHTLVHSKHSNVFRCRYGCTQYFYDETLRQYHERKTHNKSKLDNQQPNVINQNDDEGMDHGSPEYLIEYIEHDITEPNTDQTSFAAESEKLEEDFDEEIIMHDPVNSQNSKYIVKFKSRFKCCLPACSDLLPTRKVLHRHLFIYHPEVVSDSTTSCSYCGEEFNSETELNQHFLVNETRYYCLTPKCKFSTYSEAAMRDHQIANIHPKQYIVYEMRDKNQFEVTGVLNNTIEIVKPKGKFCCGCSAIFTNDDELQQHLEENHPAPSSSSNLDPTTFQCETCNSRFVTRCSYTNHLSKFAKDAYFYCTECSKFFWQIREAQCHHVREHVVSVEGLDEEFRDRFKVTIENDHSCCSCAMRFATRKELIEHQDSIHLSESADLCIGDRQCNLCREHFRTFEELALHQQTNDSEFYQCKTNYCVFKTKSFEEIKRHITAPSNAVVHIDSDGKKFKALDHNRQQTACCHNFCIYTNNDYEELIKHCSEEHSAQREMNLKQSTGAFTCDLCCKSFSSQRKLGAHKIQRRATLCNICNKFISLQQWALHTEKCTSKTTVSCKHCSKIFNFNSELRKHAQTCEKRKGNVKEPKNAELCNICGKIVPLKSFEYHMAVHTNERKWKCSKCPLAFNSEYLLGQHESKVHSDEKSCVCRFGCGKRYKYSSDLGRHEKLVHLGIKPFKCVDCQETFVRDRDLRLHRRKHTGIKLFPCAQCGDSFDVKSQYDQHVQQCGSEKTLNAQ